MKVLLDLQYLNVATTGIKTYMMELARAALSFPHPEIEWVFSHDPDRQASDDTYKHAQGKFQRLNYHLDYFRWKEFQLPDLVKKHRPDVLLCPDFVSPAASLPCKRMTVLHDAFFWQMPRNYPLWWRKYFLSLISKGLKEQTHIVTTTAYSREALRSYLKLPHPISVIYQAPKTLTNEVDQKFLETLPLQPNRFFLHVGTFDRRKNLPLLVKAFRQFLQSEGESFKLVLAGGPGQSAQMNDFPLVKKLVEDFQLERQVLMPGYLKDSQIRALYEGAYAYVFPSENEGFGIPVLEAMGLGLPVIHSDQPALLEVAGGAGLVTKTGNTKDLAKKMILLSRDNDLRAELVRKGQERSGDFSPKKFIEDFHEAILALKQT